jgi:hypothetical protein
LFVADLNVTLAIKVWCHNQGKEITPREWFRSRPVGQVSAYSQSREEREAGAWHYRRTMAVPLCFVMHEKDPKRLLELVQELNRELESLDKKRDAKGGAKSSASLSMVSLSPLDVA